MRHPYFSTSPTKMVATLELVLAGAFWGLGYVAGKWALTSMGPFAVVFLRFSIALILGWLWLKLQRTSGELAKEWRRSCLAGISLGSCLILQTIALQYTTVTRCGLLTGLYVVFVPLLEVILMRRSIPGQFWIWVLLAMLGTCLMCGLDEKLDWNAGDFFAIGCAAIAACQIVEIDRVSSKIVHPFAFNVGQSFWGALPALFFVLLYSDNFALPWTPKGYLGIAIVSIGCTLCAFWLQIRAQTVLSASVVSILFLLETVFAAGFGYLFFAEVLNVHQAVGASLILTACYQTVLLDRKSARGS